MQTPSDTLLGIATLCLGAAAAFAIHHRTPEYDAPEAAACDALRDELAALQTVADAPCHEALSDDAAADITPEACDHEPADLAEIDALKDRLTDC